MKRARFASLAALLVLAGCGSDIPPAQNYATIVGRVYDAATNGGIPGVVVTASTVLAATTASDGSYRIGNVPIGQNEIEVAVPSGYAGNTQIQIAPQPGETLTVNIPLTKTP